jgi:hypothetical protein
MIASHHARTDHADPQRLPRLGFARPLGTHINNPIDVSDSPLMVNGRQINIWLSSTPSQMRRMIRKATQTRFDSNDYTVILGQSHCGEGGNRPSRPANTPKFEWFDGVR